jgi:hypothetical protein
MSVSIDNILSDINVIHRTSSQDAFAFGHSLLPDDLQDNMFPSRFPHPSPDSWTDLERLITEVVPSKDQSPDIADDARARQVSAALRLATTYSLMAQQTLQANQPAAAAAATSNRFERLHKRIADLQARADGETARLSAMQKSIEEEK